ncbi:hypothetical protein CTI12_AA597770 [Artemisia annua]|uniref:Protein FAR1-RELATED SEQUENCE n=1 Tax=Artemisia annua TaxID=35608 RepID=A0A2U1KIU7_ARTAN|nr:hypothetical protein CTI12_AA597770 [Artemisia annua]
MNSVDLSSPIIQNEELYLSSSIFESCDDLLKSVRAFYYAKGYGLSIRDSQTDKYVTLQCQLSGSYRDVRNIGDKRKRSTASRLIECPFQIGGKKGSDGSWVFKVTNLEHNHEPSTDMSGHPSFHRLEPDDVQSVKSMTVSGIPQRQILTSLRQQTPNLPANFRTIYNLKAKIRRDDLGDRSMVRALLDELEKGGFTYDDFKDSNGRDFDIFMSTWNVVAYSTTEALFNKNWADFELFYKGKKDALDYIKKNWFPWKEKFVSAWTEKYLHFGNRASSRAEGAHAKLKKYLQVSTGDFHQVKKKLCLEIEHEFNEIKVRLASKMTSCTGHFMATMGLPCAHKIKHMKGSVLSLDLVHSHWRIDTLSLIPEDDSHDDDTNKFVMLLDELRSKYQVWPLHKKELAISVITKLVNEQDILFEPVIQRPRGRPLKAKKKRQLIKQC